MSPVHTIYPLTSSPPLPHLPFLPLINPHLSHTLLPLPPPFSDCPTLNLPDHVIADTDATSTDTVVNFSCEDGYTLEGDESMLCTDTGDWKGAVPKCTASGTSAPHQSSHSKKNNIGAIVGGVIGGILVIVLIVVATAILFWTLSYVDAQFSHNSLTIYLAPSIPLPSSSPLSLLFLSLPPFLLPPSPFLFLTPSPSSSYISLPPRPASL